MIVDGIQPICHGYRIGNYEGVVVLGIGYLHPNLMSNLCQNVIVWINFHVIFDPVLTQFV